MVLVMFQIQRQRKVTDGLTFNFMGTRRQYPTHSGVLRHPRSEDGFSRTKGEAFSRADAA
ncbi:MAG: hypothetical protein AMXMBFR82_53990 [Candidatus Hydrogenedentota bacterium]